MSIEGYPKDWARVVLAVSSSGEIHSVGGDYEPSSPGVESKYIGFERIKRHWQRIAPPSVSVQTSAPTRPDRIETFGDITEESAIVYGWRNSTACTELVIRIRDHEGREWEGSAHVDVPMKVTKEVANGKR